MYPVDIFHVVCTAKCFAVITILVNAIADPVLVLHRLACIQNTHVIDNKCTHAEAPVNIYVYVYLSAIINVQKVFFLGLFGSHQCRVGSSQE